MDGDIPPEELVYAELQASQDRLLKYSVVGREDCRTYKDFRRAKADIDKETDVNLV